MQGSLAFALSGLFHAAASYAVDKKLESAFTAFGIFAVQPVGLLVQLLAKQGLKIARFPRGVSDMLTAVLGFGVAGVHCERTCGYVSFRMCAGSVVSYS